MRHGSVAVWVVLAACGQGAVVETTSIPVSTVTSTLATTATTIAATATTQATTTTLSALIETADFAIPFAIPRGEGWKLEEVGDFGLFIHGEPGQVLMATTLGPADVAGWRDKLILDEKLSTSPPTNVTLGGFPTLTFDVETTAGLENSGLCGRQSCVVLFDHRPTPELGFAWAIVAGLPNRVWLVDVGGEAVAFFAEASRRGFAGWVAELEPALEALDWMG